MNKNFFLYIIELFLNGKYKNQENQETVPLDELVKVRTGVIFSLITILFLTISICLRIYKNGFESDFTVLLVYPIIIFLSLGVLLIKKQGSYIFNNIILMTCVAVFIPSRVLATGGINSPVLLWLILIPILGMFLFSSKTFLYFSSLILLQVIFIYYAPEFGIDYPVGERSFYLRSTMTGLGMIIFLLYSSRKEREVFEKLIEERESFSSDIKRNTLFSNIVKGMSHHINNPLSILSISSQKVQRYLEMEIPNIELAQKHNSSIEAASDRISIIMKNISVLSQMHDYGESEDYLSVQSILDNSLLKLNGKIEDKEINIIKPQIPNYVLIKGIEKVYEEVIIHIIENSIESIMNLAKKEIQVDIDYIDSHYCKLIFKDSGPGVESSIEDQIFDPFFSSKDGVHNIGLGLCLSKSLAEFYNGFLYYERVKSVGQFVLKIPRST